MLQIERVQPVVKEEHPTVDEEFTLIKSLPRITQNVTIQISTNSPTFASAAFLPPVVKQSRAVSLSAKTELESDTASFVGIALTKEAFPIHCKFCNRTVVTEPKAVPTWLTWRWSIILLPILMCLVPWWKGWGCEYHHKCGRCERVLAIYRSGNRK
jgi:hypothetical protein